jgi:hypothetical protein
MRQALYSVHAKLERRVYANKSYASPGIHVPSSLVSGLVAHLVAPAALALEPTNLLIPTLFAFLPFSCACIGCSFSHLSSSLYASTAASKFQSACCIYNVATSYLSAGGTLVSLSVLL